MDSSTGPAAGKRNSCSTAEAKAAITNSALLAHHRYTVALPTPALAATASILSSLKPTRSSNFKVLRITAYLLYTGTLSFGDFVNTQTSCTKIEEIVDVDCCPCVAQTIHVCRDGTADTDSYPGCNSAHTHGHFPRHRHSGYQHGLELS